MAAGCESRGPPRPAFRARQEPPDVLGIRRSARRDAGARPGRQREDNPMPHPRTAWLAVPVAALIAVLLHLALDLAQAESLVAPGRLAQNAPAPDAPAQSAPPPEAAPPEAAPPGAAPTPGPAQPGDAFGEEVTLSEKTII